MQHHLVHLVNQVNYNKSDYYHKLCAGVPPPHVWNSPTVSPLCASIQLHRWKLDFIANALSRDFHLTSPHLTCCHVEPLNPPASEHWLSSQTSSRFRNHLSAAQATVSKGVSAGCANSAITQWEQWISFTSELGLNSFLQAFNDKIPILQVFIKEFRDGELAAYGNPIKSRSVEDYLRAVAQTFLSVGTDNPRLNRANKTDFKPVC